MLVVDDHAHFRRTVSDVVEATPGFAALGEAGSGEELLTDVIDLDAVARVRRLGTAGVSRMWEQLDRGAASELELPMYAEGRIQPRPAD